MTRSRVPPHEMVGDDARCMIGDAFDMI